MKEGSLENTPEPTLAHITTGAGPVGSQSCHCGPALISRTGGVGGRETGLFETVCSQKTLLTLSFCWKTQESCFRSGKQGGPRGMGGGAEQPSHTEGLSQKNLREATQDSKRSFGDT
jgi:hypothetical protein